MNLHLAFIYNNQIVEFSHVFDEYLSEVARVHKPKIDKNLYFGNSCCDIVFEVYVPQKSLIFVYLKGHMET